MWSRVLKILLAYILPGWACTTCNTSIKFRCKGYGISSLCRGCTLFISRYPCCNDGGLVQGDLRSLLNEHWYALYKKVATNDILFDVIKCGNDGNFCNKYLASFK